MLSNIFKFVLVMICTSLIVSCNSKAIIHPTSHSVTEAVYASGKVVPFNNYLLFSLVNGTLTNQLVNEGDALHQGQVMFQIESNDPLNKLQLSEEVYKTAAQNYSSNSPVLLDLESKLSTAKAKVLQDSLDFVRNKNLFDANAIAKHTMELAQLKFTASKNEYIQLQQNYNKVKQQLYVEMLNAKTQWEIAKNDAGYYNVKSNTNGMVFSIFKKPGELVHQGEMLAMCGNADSFYVQMMIDESDINKVKTGQQVMLQLEMFGDSIISGTVLKIFPGIDPQTRSVRVDVGFNKPITGLFANATAEGNIITHKKDKALMIPKNLLLPGDSVLVDRVFGDSKKNIKVPVKTGIETEEEIEIISGLTADEDLVVKK